MTNRKTTRRALVLSLLSLLVCCSMLVGTTFAWFTDSVQSGNNKIVAGNLDVELYHTSASVATKESVAGNTSLFVDENGKAILWEPGVVTYENLTVANLGTLALKYELAVNFTGENTVVEADGTATEYKLSDVLKVACIPGGIQGTTREAVKAEAEAATVKMNLAAFTESGMLLPMDIEIPNAPADAVEGEKTYGIVIWWEPTASDNNWNVNNGKTTSDGAEALQINLGIQLVATQLMAEDDSFDNTYDENAAYPPMTNVTPINNAAIDLGGGETLALNAAYNIAPAADKEDRLDSPYAFYNVDFVVSFDKDIVSYAVNLFVEYNEDGYQSYYIPTENKSAYDIVTKDTDYRILNDLDDYYRYYDRYASFGKNGSYNIGVYEFTHAEWEQIQGWAAEEGVTLGDYPSGTTMTIEVRLYETEYKGLENGDNGLPVYEETGEYIVVDTITYTFG